MLRVGPSIVKQLQVSVGGVSSTSQTLDTLSVLQITITQSQDSDNGAITVLFAIGTTVNGVFQDNSSRIIITFLPNGTFSSSDGSVSGSGADVTNILSAVTAVDNLMLAIGVGGNGSSIIANPSFNISPQGQPQTKQAALLDNVQFPPQSGI